MIGLIVIGWLVCGLLYVYLSGKMDRQVNSYLAAPIFSGLILGPISLFMALVFLSASLLIKIYDRGFNK